MVTAAIVGPGNIGTDLLAKLRPQRAGHGAVHGRRGPGIGRAGRARALGRGGLGGRRGLAAEPGPSCRTWSSRRRRPEAHRANAPRYAQAGIRAVDLTPAAVGPLVCPPVNLEEHRDAPNLNMITCGGQATIPMVARGVAR